MVLFKTKLLMANQFGLRWLSSSARDRIIPASEIFTWDTHNAVKLRMDDTETGKYTPILVQTMMREAVKKYGPKLALVDSQADIAWTYNQYYAEVEKATKGFISLGLQPYNGVGILAHNHPYWFVSSLAAIFAGGLSCGIYTTNAASTVSFICNHAPLDIMVIESEATLDSLIEKEPTIGDVVKAFVIMSPTREIVHKKAISWDAMIEKGQGVAKNDLEEREKMQAVNKACMLIYTSGTTGPPKGAILSHDNVTWSLRICMEHYEWNQERLLSYLPLSHVAACLIDCYMAMYVGCEVHFADKEALKGTLVDNLRRVRPTKFLGVPRVWEKIAEKMQEVGKSSKGAKKLIATWAKAQATEHHTNIRNGKIELGGKGSLSYRIAKALVFNRIHQALGLDEAVKTPVPTSSSAAPLNLETFYYFQSLDIVLTTLLGCTETSGPQTCNMGGPLNRPGSEGKAYRGVQNKILNADPEGYGEIATWARNVFMGYHKDEAKTREAFQDGWFKSGDLGKIDEDGFMWMSGRLKELLITSGGENIAPVPIEENILAEMPQLLSSVVVVGDKRKYLSCLVALKVDEAGILLPEAKDWCQTVQKGCKVETIADFKANSSLTDAVLSAIKRANKKAVANPHHVQKFAILPTSLSIEGGELGPTLKMKRHFIAEKYSDLIKSMYE